jgi:lipoteichoic acid synthase
MPTQTPSATALATPKVYGYNKMELNLSGGSGKIKDLNNYVSTLTATKQNDFTGLFKGKNLIFITAEAFTAELIRADLNPTLYRLATKGIQFLDYYQPSSAGTTGGEYQNVFGMLPTQGGKSFKTTANNLNYFTLGSQFNRIGYYGKAYHNNSYTYYNRNITHNNLGYSDGFMGKGNGMEQYVKGVWPQSDYEMISGTLPTYIDKENFNIYYMSVSGHSGYTKTGNMMTYRNWDVVKDLPYSDVVKGYFAANYELEKALTHLVGELEKKGIADDTVICISADHFPYGLQGTGKLGEMPALNELYGKEVNDIFTRDHNRLIIWSGCLEEKEPIVVSSPTSSLDILPTLSNLFGLEFDSRLFVGRDVFSEAPALVFNSGYDWKTDYGTYIDGKFTPTDPSVQLPENYISNMKTVVRNKMKYCQWCLESDYF